MKLLRELYEAARTWDVIVYDKDKGREHADFQAINATADGAHDAVADAISDLTDEGNEGRIASRDDSLKQWEVEVYDGKRVIVEIVPRSTRESTYKLPGKVNEAHSQSDQDGTYYDVIITTDGYEEAQAVRVQAQDVERHVQAAVKDITSEMDKSFFHVEPMKDWEGGVLITTEDGDAYEIYPERSAKQKPLAGRMA